MSKALEPWPMAFDISMGVRRGNEPLRRQIDAVLGRENPSIERILARYRVP